MHPINIRFAFSIVLEKLVILIKLAHPINISSALIKPIFNIGVLVNLLQFLKAPFASVTLYGIVYTDIFSNPQFANVYSKLATSPNIEGKIVKFSQFSNVCGNSTTFSGIIILLLNILQP